MFLLTLLLLAPDWPLVESSEFPPAAQRAALAATVRVVPPGRVGIGSGVVVGRRDGRAYILTARHLLTYHPPQPPEVEWFTAAGYPKSVDSARAKYDTEWPDLDLALLTIPDVPTLPAVPLAPRDAGDAQDFPALTVGCNTGAAPTVQPVTVRGKKLVLRKPGDVNRFFWETAVAPVLGRSGGPLLDRDGRLLGICSAAREDQARGYFVHLSEIRHALKRPEYAWLLEGQSK